MNVFIFINYTYRHIFMLYMSSEHHGSGGLCLKDVNTVWRSLRENRWNRRMYLMDLAALEVVTLNQPSLSCVFCNKKLCNVLWLHDTDDSRLPAGRPDIIVQSLQIPRDASTFLSAHQETSDVAGEDVCVPLEPPSGGRSYCPYWSFEQLRPITSCSSSSHLKFRNISCWERYNKGLLYHHF